MDASQKKKVYWIIAWDNLTPMHAWCIYFLTTIQKRKAISSYISREIEKQETSYTRKRRHEIQPLWAPHSPQICRLVEKTCLIVRNFKLSIWEKGMKSSLVLAGSLFSIESLALNKSSLELQLILLLFRLARWNKELLANSYYYFILF